MAASPSIVAGVLVGGKSLRMGTDKANLPWGGTTMLEAVVQAARGVCSQCVLLGTGSRLPPSLKLMTQLPDAYSGIGPIAGLAALLSHYPRSWCLLLSCDIPGVTPRTIDLLSRHIGRGTTVVVYRCDGRLEPCCAFYHGAILPEVRRAVADGDYSIHHLIESLPHTAIDADAAVRQSLRNINTRADYDPGAH